LDKTLIREATVAKEPDRRGHEIIRKTIARGMPGQTGVTVVTMLAGFILFCLRGCGRNGARHSLRPLIFQKVDASGKPRANDAARSRMRVLW
jgi:hypothetical protein